MESAILPAFIGRAGDIHLFSKPAGLAVHRTDQDEPNLVDWLDQHDEYSGLVPAHRLDKPTSGLIMTARDAGERQKIGEWLAGSEVEKTYIAVVHGRARPKGIIKRALKDARRGRALSAVTRYRTIHVGSKCSILKVRIETGRKHQIRRHLEGLGHPIVGDRRYRGRTGKRAAEGALRMGLHSWSVRLPDGAPWRAPIPKDLIDLLVSIEGPEAKIVFDGLEDQKKEPPRRDGH